MFSTETYFLSKTRRTNRHRDWKNFYTSQGKYKIALWEAQTQKLDKVLRCRKTLKRGLVHMPVLKGVLRHQPKKLWSFSFRNIFPSGLLWTGQVQLAMILPKGWWPAREWFGPLYPFTLTNCQVKTTYARHWHTGPVSYPDLSSMPGKKLRFFIVKGLCCLFQK